MIPSLLSESFALGRWLILLAAGLVMPGWLLGKVFRVPGGPAGMFLGSAALLMNLVLVFAALGWTLDLADLGLGLAVVCSGLAMIARYRPLRSAVSPVTLPSDIRPAWRRDPILLLPAAIGLGAIMIRAGLDPLSGWDSSFRWDFLARQIVRLGHLDFYPAIRAEDFTCYGWCDGIAPFVASLYAWSYLSLGRIEAWASAPLVVAQGILIFYGVARLAGARGGTAAAATALALLVSSASFLWGVAMGQETGLTTLALVAMFWFLEQHRATPHSGWLAWAGMAAGTGALAREYGLCFPLLGLVALQADKVPRRRWLLFLGTAALVALPWYARNWVRTGHPLYSLDLGPLFPVNPVYTRYEELVQLDFGITHHPLRALTTLPVLVMLLAGAPLALGLVGGFSRWRESAPCLVAIGVLTLLWLSSIGLTSGGSTYSLRVLAPAIALGAVLGGTWLARVASRWRGWTVGVLTGLAVHAGMVSLYLPIDSTPAWWRERWSTWREFGRMHRRWNDQPQWRAMAEAAEGRKILVTDPLVQTVLFERGAKPVSLFSPEVRFLFRPGLAFAAGRDQLRAEGFRFVVIMRGNGFLNRQLGAHPFFVSLVASPPVISAPLYFVYDLSPPELRR